MNEVGEHKGNQHQHAGDPLVNWCACVDKLLRGLAYCDSKRKQKKMTAQGQNMLPESLTARTFTGLDLACWIWTPYIESRGSKTIDLHTTVSTINYWGFQIRNSKFFQHGILGSKFTQLFMMVGLIVICRLIRMECGWQLAKNIRTINGKFCSDTLDVEADIFMYQPRK